MTPRLNVAPRECPSCGATFTPYRSTTRVCSKACYRRLPETVAKQAERNARPAIRARKNAARRIENNPDRVVTNRVSSLRRYGLTPEQYDAMYGAQGGVCAICSRAASGARAASRLHVDHDHATGVVRALLCNNCNRGIGYPADSPERLRMAADYLARHKN